MRIKDDSKIKNVLKLVSPGTNLREGLDNILRAKTGGLIVLSNSDEVMKLVDGGFNINAEYSPAYIYELAKMDGAIVLSEDLKKIVCANAQLLPDPSVSTFETGTRHRTAQRIAKQTEAIVIAISQRRNLITIYKNDIKYILQDSSVILARANQAIQTLEKYVNVLERVINNLNILEFQDLTTVYDVVTAIQRTEMVMRIVEEIKRYILELGNEGRLISMQLNELIKNIERDGILLLKDYCKEDTDHTEIYNELQKLNSDELVDLEIIAKVLGFGGCPLTDTLISPKGYRILFKIPRIPTNVIENMIKHFGKLNKVITATADELDQVEGIGEARASAIRSGLKRIQEKVNLKKEL